MMASPVESPSGSSSALGATGPFLLRFEAPGEGVPFVPFFEVDPERSLSSSRSPSRSVEAAGFLNDSMPFSSSSFNWPDFSESSLPDLTSVRGPILTDPVSTSSAGGGGGGSAYVRFFFSQLALGGGASGAGVSEFDPEPAAQSDELQVPQAGPP